VRYSRKILSKAKGFAVELDIYIQDGVFLVSGPTFGNIRQV
jgi:hypothetical protein